jgi:uncharacterized Zn finger protein (UPF0148 family)
MSEPEIARRCHHCGVSLRQTALFCPQCGQPLGDNQSEELADNETPRAAVPESPLHDLPAASHPSTVRERVEKIRHVSSVVIDQAAYDPSLRFILVAAVLFVLFLVLLIVSKVIG